MSTLLDLPNEVILQVLCCMDNAPLPPKSFFDLLSTRLRVSAVMTATTCLTWAGQVATLRNIGISLALLFGQGGWKDPLCLGALFLVVGVSDSLHTVWHTFFRGVVLPLHLHLLRTKSHCVKTSPNLLSLSRVNHRLHSLCADYSQRKDIHDHKSTPSETFIDLFLLNFGKGMHPTDFD